MSNARNLSNLLNSSGDIEKDKLDNGAIHGRRNMIINGAMTINQRNASTSLTGNGTIRCLDRFFYTQDQVDELAVTLSKSTESPDGFTNSLRVQVTTKETTLASDEAVYVAYRIEGGDVQHLEYGTSNAKTTTLTFYVRSSETGTYCLLAYLPDATRSYVKEYTIDTADTWQKVTMTFEGDTDSGATITNDSTEGYSFYWTLAAGDGFKGTPHTGWGAYVQTDDFATSNQENFVAQTGNFYLTGVQFEVGTATDFEHKTFAEELLLCERYYHKTAKQGAYPAGGTLYSGNATYMHVMNFYSTNNANYSPSVTLPVQMAKEPTITSYGTSLDTANQASGYVTVYGDQNTWKNIAAATYKMDDRHIAITSNDSTQSANTTAGFAGLAFLSFTAEAEI